MTSRAVFAACLLALVQGVACASPGDVFVPAHRTRDGSFVPPNVAPMSGGSTLAKRPSRGRVEPVSGRREVPVSMRIKAVGSRASR